jgi:hypothetical protein
MVFAAHVTSCGGRAMPPYDRCASLMASVAQPATASCWAGSLGNCAQKITREHLRIRVTTPNVLKALRKRDPGAAKPYNFALSPILTQARQNCTLVAPFSKHPEDWLTRDYTEIHTGDLVRLNHEYCGKKLLPQTLSSVLWRHCLHPEEKSLGPDGSHCEGWDQGTARSPPAQGNDPIQPN